MAQNNIKETFTIPSELLKKLSDYSKQTMIPKSRLVSKLLKDFFEKEVKNGKPI